MFRLPNLLIFSTLILITLQVNAQKAGLEVTRCTAVDQSLTLKNVCVDASGRKWAANSKGVFQLKSPESAVATKPGSDERNVLAYRGGNTDFSWSESAFRRIVTEPCSVTSAWYDAKTQQLWLGTDEAGLFQFNTTPELKLIQQYKTVNSKLKSNNISIVFMDAAGRIWAGTDQGIMYGKPGLWKHDLPGTQVQRVREFNTVIYVLADGFISKAPGGDKWSDLALDEKQLRGDINDFDIDPSGKMWIVSGNLVRFDMIANTYDAFGSADNYLSQYGNLVAAELDGAVWVGTEDKGLFFVNKAYDLVLNAFVDKPISCEGNGKDAVLMAKVTGGVEPITYQWSNGLAGESPKDVGPGKYGITITDAKGKTRNAEVGVADTRLKAKALQKKPVSSPSAADGVGVVDIPTNASGIVVLWDNGENLATATKLSAGEHSVTVTDPKGCTVVLKVVISEVAQPVSASLTEAVPVKCFGGTGTVTVDVKGGKAPYLYAWSNASISGNKPDNVVAGTYTVTVTDATKATSTAGITIGQPDALTLGVLVQAPAGSGKADGKALAQAKGGKGVYAFKWDNTETVFAATKLAAGKHTLTVSDGNGCTAVANFEIPENVITLTVSIRETGAIKCAGETSALQVEVKGGKGGPKFAWSNPQLNGDKPSAVPAGDYTVTVTDLAGNTASASIKVKSPQPFTASAIAQGVVSPGGADGKALVMTAGGTGTHYFKWDNDEVTAATMRLTSGLHTVTVTDDNGCVTTTTVTLSETAIPLGVTIVEKTGIKCAGEKAKLAVEVSGGKPDYRYAWNQPSATGDAPSVAAGDYVLTVTDKAGATKTASISIKAPAPLTVVVEMQSAATAGNNDGKARAKAGGGSGAYIFQWESGESTDSAQRLGPGTGKVTVTDANGCQAIGSVTITEQIDALQVSISEKTPIKCSGLEKSALQVNVSGGKRPYSFAWNSTALRDGAPDGILPGDYEVTVTDAKGSTKTAKITVKAPEPLQIAIVENIGASSATAADGKAKIEIKGGTTPYKIGWDNKQSGITAQKLTAGPHSVTVNDAAGCSQQLNFETGKRALVELTKAIEQGQTIPMRLLTFETDSSSLRPGVYAYLDELYNFLVENPAVSIEVAGHTNNQPKDDFADYLSTARARAVANYLTTKGIDAKRVQYKGYGKRQPLVPNTTPEGRRTNQRVEIRILTTGK